MRVVICTRARLLGKALSDGLRDCGDQVIAITSSTQSASSAIRRTQPDVLVADRWADADLSTNELDVPVILLCDDARPTPLSKRGTTPTFVPRGATLSAIIATIHDTDSGGRPASCRRAGRAGRAGIRAANGSGQLARFLSNREREVLSELVLGADTATVAARLRISRNTARDHIQSVLTKLNAHSRLELVSIAVRDALVDPTTGAWLDVAG